MLRKSFRQWRNYLRVRGEYIRNIYLSGAKPELPPRARRIPVTNDSTPPYDGNYLRVRGEYLHMDKQHPGEKELPPRARRIRVRGRVSY